MTVPKPIGAGERPANGSDGVCAPPARRVAARMAKPVPIVTLIGCGFLMLACNVNATLGPHAVAFKLRYPHWFMLAVIVMAACRISRLPDATRVAAAVSAARSLPSFVALCLLIGVHGLVSNGVDYRSMASDYWDSDPFAATSRRIALPVAAHVLGLDGRWYIVFWYGLFFLAAWASLRLLVGLGLSRLEALSVATSSILAYALEGPGYGEVAVLLLGLCAMRFELGPTSKIVVAALMIATHETATAFAALAVILEADAEDRREWLVAFGCLYPAYVASYLVTWHADLVSALLRSVKANARAETTAAQLASYHPRVAALGAFLAYKLYWLPVVAGLRRKDSRTLAVLTLASLALVVVGTDTSRLVQYSSLSLYLTVTSELRHRPRAARRWLATANLLTPSLYVAVNAGLLWGPGLYALYLRAATDLGLPLGTVWR